MLTQRALRRWLVLGALALGALLVAGGVRELEHHTLPMAEMRTLETANVEGVEWLAKRVPLPQTLQLGYHRGLRAEMDIRHQSESEKENSGRAPGYPWPARGDGFHRERQSDLQQRHRVTDVIRRLRQHRRERLKQRDGETAQGRRAFGKRRRRDHPAGRLRSPRSLFGR